jgi:hypothetical protein
MADIPSNNSGGFGALWGYRLFVGGFSPTFLQSKTPITTHDPPNPLMKTIVLFPLMI